MFFMELNEVILILNEKKVWPAFTFPKLTSKQI